MWTSCRVGNSFHGGESFEFLTFDVSRTLVTLVYFKFTSGATGSPSASLSHPRVWCGKPRTSWWCPGARSSASAVSCFPFLNALVWRDILRVHCGERHSPSSWPQKPKRHAELAASSCYCGVNTKSFGETRSIWSRCHGQYAEHSTSLPHVATAPHSAFPAVNLAVSFCVCTFPLPVCTIKDSNDLFTRVVHWSQARNC